MKYQTQSIAKIYFIVAMALFLVQVIGRAARRVDLRDAQHALRAGALQHRPDAAHQQPRRLAPARLLRGRLLHRARRGGERDLLAHARLRAARDPRARHPRRRGDLPLQPLRGQLPLRNPGPRVPRTAHLGQDRHRRGRADLPVQHLHDRAHRPQDRDRQRPPARALGTRAPLPLRLLQPRQPLARQDVLVVRDPSLGRGRLGADHGLDPRLPDAQADRRRPRGGREMALRHRRHSPFLGHPRHRPPLLLDRNARLLAVDRLDLLLARDRPVLRDDGLRLRHGLEGQARPSQQGRAPLVARHRRAGVLRRGRLGLPAHAPWRELLQPRHPDHGRARASRLLRRLCLPQLRDLHLRHADPARPRSLQPGDQHGLVLADVGRRRVHDLHAHLRGHRADPSAARARHGLHGRAGPAGGLLLDALRCGRRSRARSGALRLRHPRPAPRGDLRQAPTSRRSDRDGRKPENGGGFGPLLPARRATSATSSPPPPAPPCRFSSRVRPAAARPASSPTWPPRSAGRSTRWPATTTSPPPT